MSSVICCFNTFAKLSLSEKLSHAIESQDEELMHRLYSGIVESDIKQLPDSSLLDYYFIGGFINSEENNHDKAIAHFMKAKEICDQRLGTHNIGYMVVMRNLGEQYYELGDYKKALSFYEEGIIKTMAIKNWDTQSFANLIMGVQECYDRMGLFNEIPRLLLDAWNFWDINNEEFTTYDYFPLWCLEQFYRRFEIFEEAIKVSDVILKFISERGYLMDPKACEELYFRGNILVSMGKTLEGVETYQKALNILDKNNLLSTELYSQILGNLLIAIIKTDKWEKYNSILEKIKEYGDNLNDNYVYKNALYSLTKTFNELGNYNEALLISDKLSQQNLSIEERNVIEQQRKDIGFNKEVIESKNTLEDLFESLSNNSAQWFDTCHKLSSAYYLTNDIAKNFTILTQMYQSIKNDSSVGNDYFLWVLNSLVGIYLETGDYDNALKFAIEKKLYLESIPNVPQDILYAAMKGLIVSKLRSNNVGDIDEDLEECRYLCLSVYGEKSSNYGIFLHNKARAYQLQGKFNEAKQTYLEAIDLQREFDGKPMARTVQFLMDLENQIVDEELND